MRPRIRSPKVEGERRVHVLATELVDRVREYALKRGLRSEVDAVRELLSIALDERDARRKNRSA